MSKSGIKRPLVIKTSPRLVPVTHIRTNITTAGMTRERYFELREKVGCRIEDAVTKAQYANTNSRMRKLLESREKERRDETQEDEPESNNMR